MFRCGGWEALRPGGTEPLELTVDLLPGAGHLNVEAGYGPWPEMEAWCLGERSALTARTSGLRPGGPTSGGVPAVGTT